MEKNRPIYCTPLYLMKNAKIHDERRNVLVYLNSEKEVEEILTGKKYSTINESEVILLASLINFSGVYSAGKWPKLYRIDNNIWGLKLLQVYIEKHDDIEKYRRELEEFEKRFYNIEAEQEKAKQELITEQEKAYEMLRKLTK